MAASNKPSVWATMKDAKIVERGEKCKAGTFELMVEQAIEFDTFERGLAFIVTFRVTDSNNPEQPIGSTCSFYQGLDGKSATVAPGIILKFLRAALGYDDIAEKELFDTEVRPLVDRLMVQATGENNVLAGLRLLCESKASTYVDRTTKEVVPTTEQTYKPFPYVSRGMARPIAANLANGQPHDAALARGVAAANAATPGTPPGAPPPRVPPGAQFQPAGATEATATHYWVAGMAGWEPMPKAPAAPPPPPAPPAPPPPPAPPAPPAPPPPPPGPSFPPGTHFHPTGTTPGNGAKMAWPPGATAWQNI